MIHVEHHGPVLAIRMARSLLGRPFYWTAAYWVDGLLIDTGPRCTAGELMHVLEQVNVERIVVTHCHEDSTGGLAKLRERYPQVNVYAPHQALPVIQNPDRLALPLYRQLIWGRPQPVEAVRSLHETGNVIDTPSYAFRVIDTPGHSRDHVSLYEPTQRWVFCGDAFIGGSDPNWARDEDLFGVISSLQTLASLRPGRLFSGSGSVYRTPLPDIHGRISWLSRLACEVAELDAAGLSGTEMVDRLFQGESSMRIWTGGYFSAANLIHACRSYNALVLPIVGGPEEIGGRWSSGTTTADSADSSASQSADLGDVVR